LLARHGWAAWISNGHPGGQRHKKGEAKASPIFHSWRYLIYEKAMPAIIKSAKPTAGITQVFFLTNSVIFFLQ